MLNPDFREMLSCFVAAEVEFIVVGAYALAAHGYVHATSDIGLWINNSADNCQRVMGALTAFGAPTTGYTFQDLMNEGSVIQVGTEPTRVDILSGIDGVSFNLAYPRCLVTTIESLPLYILSKADLLANKLASRRDKDLSDIAWLQKQL